MAEKLKYCLLLKDMKFNLSKMVVKQKEARQFLVVRAALVMHVKTG